ncbi:hypothetical protein SaO326_00449 [Staphylococcus aureus]|nr:hypothetical protein SaO326_00449 [Staphylococcus aureus]
MPTSHIYSLCKRIVAMSRNKYACVDLSPFANFMTYAFHGLYSEPHILPGDKHII